jgi:hypothetical protein
VPIDAVALPRNLIAWLTSDAGRLATERLLAPLDELGPARSLTAVRTLDAWLDEQGSLLRCAERRHLHRNAVGYRIRQIRERLDVDLDNPAQRLAVQLACRSRLLAGRRLGLACGSGGPRRRGSSHTRSQVRPVADKVAVDDACTAASLSDRPHDERLAATGVAGGEHVRA